MYQHLSAKSRRQILMRAGKFVDLPAHRAGNVLRLVSIAGSQIGTQPYKTDNIFSLTSHNLLQTLLALDRVLCTLGRV